jgi:hypothetical protein
MVLALAGRVYTYSKKRIAFVSYIETLVMSFDAQAALSDDERTSGHGWGLLSAGATVQAVLDTPKEIARCFLSWTTARLCPQIAYEARDERLADAAAHAATLEARIAQLEAENKLLHDALVKAVQNAPEGTVSSAHDDRSPSVGWDTPALGPLHDLNMTPTPARASRAVGGGIEPMSAGSPSEPLLKSQCVQSSPFGTPAEVSQRVRAAANSLCPRSDIDSTPNLLHFVNMRSMDLRGMDLKATEVESPLASLHSADRYRSFALTPVTAYASARQGMHSGRSPVEFVV